MPDIPVLTAEVADTTEERRRPLGRASYVSGPTDQPLRFVTLGQLLDEAVAAHGSRAAAVFCADRRVFSWNDLHRQAEQVAGAMLALGMQRGDRVGIWAPTRHEWLATLFGAARIGAAVVNLPPISRASELEGCLNKTRCRAVFLARATESVDQLALLRGLAPELDRPSAKPVLDARRLPHLKHVVVLGEGLVPACAQRYSDFVCMAPASTKRRLTQLAATLDADDVANIQFTSGTTGPIKGATLSHFSVVNNALGAARAMALADSDKLCIAMPLHHGLGLVAGLLAGVSVGATLVFPGERPDTLQTLDAVSRHRCTALHGDPALFEAFLAHPERSTYDTGGLRTGVLAGESGRGDLVPRLMHELQMDELTVAYGLAEAGPLVFQSTLDDAPEVRASTVGRVLPHMEAKAIGADGQIVPVGAVGELCCRGYAVTHGYCDDAKRTREAIDASGWLHTGDLATIDPEGYCRIIGRVGDAIERSGRTVHALEVESVIREHPSVQAVQVFGVADGEQGQDICACIVLKEGETTRPNEIVAFCRKHNGAGRAPRHVRFMAAFPLSASGKPRKYLLRAAMVRALEQTRTRSA